LYFYWKQGKEPNIAIDPEIEYSGLLKLNGVSLGKTKQPNGLRYGTTMKAFPREYNSFIPEDPQSHVGRMFVVREESLPSFLSGLASIFENGGEHGISLEPVTNGSPSLDEALIPQASIPDAEDSAAQGYEKDPVIRRAIEQHAVKLAREHYLEDGYHVKELGKPFDLLCEKQGEVIHVEVKGSRSMLDTVIVTINEINDARLPSWRSDLFIVEGIVAEYDILEKPKTRGGSSRVLRNWAPKDSDLKPSQFRYSLPSRDDWITINSDK
jgi:hypothetical protein